MTRTIMWLAMVVVLGSTLAARGQTPQAMDLDGSSDTDAGRDLQARRLFDAARVAFDNGRYDQALTLFTEAYELSPRPRMLYNIAYSSQLSNQNERALEAYRDYLEAIPDAPNRAGVESRIRALEQSIAERRANEEAAARGDALGPAVVMGIGGASVVAGVVFLALARRAASTVEDAPMGTAWRDLSSDYDDADTFGVVGGVLLGVGGAALVAGLTWLLSARGGDDDVSVGIGPGSLTLRGHF